MASETRHLSARIAKPADAVYDYVSNAANLTEWAAGLCTSIEEVDGQWIAESPMGRIVVAFAPKNEFGVVDHEVTVTSGETFYNPMRVIADGSGCEVVFTLRRQPEMTDDEFDRDAEAVTADLAMIKRVLESA